MKRVNAYYKQYYYKRNVCETDNAMSLSDIRI